MKAKAIQRIDEALNNLQYAVTPKDVTAALRMATTRLGKVSSKPEFVKAIAAIEAHEDLSEKMKRKEYDTMQLFHEAFQQWIQKGRELIQDFRSQVNDAELPEGGPATASKVTITGHLVKTKEPVEINVGAVGANFLQSPQFHQVLAGKQTMQAGLALYLAEMKDPVAVDKEEDYPALYRGVKRALNSFFPKAPKADKPAKEKKTAAAKKEPAAKTKK